MQEGVGYGSDYDIAARAANRSTIEYLNCSQRRGSSVLQYLQMQAAIETFSMVQLLEVSNIYSA